MSINCPIHNALDKLKSGGYWDSDHNSEFALKVGVHQRICDSAIYAESQYIISHARIAMLPDQLLRKSKSDAVDAQWLGLTYTQCAETIFPDYKLSVVHAMVRDACMTMTKLYDILSDNADKLTRLGLSLAPLPRSLINCANGDNLIGMAGDIISLINQMRITPMQSNKINVTHLMPMPDITVETHDQIIEMFRYIKQIELNVANLHNSLQLAISKMNDMCVYVLAH